MAFRILIGADLVPTKSNYELFIKGDSKELIGIELETIIKKADFTVFNLEVPLTDTKAPISKCGPALIAPTTCINGIKKNYICLFDYLFISSQMSAKPYFIGSTGILLLW